MKTAKHVILGGGMVAGYAAKKFVELGLKPGELTIVSAENSLPYERPPLSKGFLAGKDTEESIRISQQDFYNQHGIEVRLDTVVAGLDAKQKALRLRSGESVGFENLIVATGAQVRRLKIPGADLKGVYYLRSNEDSKRIREAAQGAKTALVIGGGFIAMEVSAVLAQKGIQVTMAFPEDRVWKRLFTPAMSRFFESYYTARGVRIVKEAQITELRGDGSVESARLANGESVACDIAVAGIGVTPVTDVLAGSGIEVNDGVMVNEFLETNQPGIYAAGDVANYHDSLFGKRRRAEHWDNAVSQGQHCATVLSGARAPFVHVPYFFSDVFDLSYEFWGDTSDSDRQIEQGDITSNSFSVWWLRENRLVAAFTMNRPDEEREAAPKWIQSGEPAPLEMLTK